MATCLSASSCATAVAAPVTCRCHSENEARVSPFVRETAAQHGPGPDGALKMVAAAVRGRGVGLQGQHQAQAAFHVAEKRAADAPSEL